MRHKRNIKVNVSTKNKGDLVKILWHDGLGMSLYAKGLDRGKFIWPAAPAGARPCACSANVGAGAGSHA
jgi:hypothetical protein